MRKTLRINGGNEIGKTVEKSLDEYFRKLDGEPPHGIYDMVITHVERAVIVSVMTRANGNQTQAADMLGMNRNTLRERMRALLPCAVETVYDNYNALVFGYGPSEKASECVFPIAAYPKWVTLFFLHGATLPDPDHVLDGEGSQERYK